MADASRTYTAEQVAIAARDLRDAAGAVITETGSFTGGGPNVTDVQSQTTEASLNVEQVVDALNPEIRLLRERGFTDERTADLLRGFDIEVTAHDIHRYYRNAADVESSV